MGWTKRQFVESAFEEIGLANYVFDLQPEQLNLAMRRMDAMMATWNSKGIRVGYPIPDSPQNSSLDDATNVPDRANEAIYTNLAIRIAPTVGKIVNPDTKAAAKAGYDVLLSRAAVPPEMQYPNTLPIGAGNKPWANTENPFVEGPVDNLQVGPDSDLELY